MILCSNDKRQVAITMFNHARDIQGHWEGKATKKEMLEKVGEWWDDHGTGLNDFDGIQVMFQFEPEENDG